MSITLWRICKRDFARTIFDGAGAATHPGRWNTAGVPALYCSASLPLAVLEVLVHLRSARVLREYVFASVRIDPSHVVDVRDDVAAMIRTGDVPGEDITRAIGVTAFAQRVAALRVPSVVLRSEHNVVLDPRHPAVMRAAKSAPQPLPIDSRILALTASS